MRRGFTLVEMLVAITIILILAGLTIGTAFVAMDTERTRGAARQIQSFLEGAKSRATFEQRIYGVRFMLDESGATPRVRSMLYLLEPEPATEGRIEFESDGVTITGTGTGWRNLRNRGLLSQWSRIKIPNEKNGEWFRVVDFGPDWADDTQPERLQINKPHPNNPTGALTYKLQLNPMPAPNQEPTPLGKGVIVDLDSCVRTTDPTDPSIPVDPNDPQNRVVPVSWGVAPNWSDHMDVLFTPSGNMADASMAFGFIHLVIADEGDVEQGRDVWTIDRDYEPLIATIRTATGAVSTHSRNPYDGDGNGRADDPFRWAETGK